MTTEKPLPAPVYTCNEYREEMILLALMKQLHDPGLTEEQRGKIAKEIALLEEKSGW